MFKTTGTGLRHIPQTDAEWQRCRLSQYSPVHSDCHIENARCQIVHIPPEVFAQRAYHPSYQALGSENLLGFERNEIDLKLMAKLHHKDVILNAEWELGNETSLDGMRRD